MPLSVERPVGLLPEKTSRTQAPDTHSGVSPEHVPQLPPQPSLPHEALLQSGVQLDSHTPALQKGVEASHCPQLPLHPSSPHIRVPQSGTQTAPQTPALQKGVALSQVPQLPPQPSLPQTADPQLGMHVLDGCELPGCESPLEPHPASKSANQDKSVQGSAMAFFCMVTPYRNLNLERTLRTGVQTGWEQGHHKPPTRPDSTLRTEQCTHAAGFAIDHVVVHRYQDSYCAHS